MMKCGGGEISLLKEKILFVDIESQQEITVDDVREFQAAAMGLAEGEKLYSIVNYGAYTLPSKEAREYCLNQETDKYLLGRAIVVNDMGQMILARHTLKRTTKKIPLEIFTNIEDAKEWINQLKMADCVK